MLHIGKDIKDDKATLYLTGRLDTVTAPEMEETVRTSLEGVTDLVIDMTELEYISSAGLRTLVVAQKLLVKNGGQMRVRGAGSAVREIFEVTGFSSILTIE